MALITKVAEWDTFSASGSTTTLVLTLPGGASVPAGDNLLVMAVIGATPRTAVFTDSKGNTWATHKDWTRVSGVNTTVSAGSCKVTTPLVAGDTITVTWNSAAGGRVLKVVQYTGGRQAGWFDQVTAGGGNDVLTSSTITGLTTATDNELLVGVAGVEGSGTFTSVSGTWTNEAGQASGTTVRVLDWASKTKTPAGAEGDLTVTFGGGMAVNSFMLAFLPEPAGGSTGADLLLMGVG